MAYINQEMKKELAPGIKAALSKHALKGTIAVENQRTIVVKVKGLPELKGRHSHITPEEHPALQDLWAALNVGNFDNSCPHSNYHNQGWYASINVL